MSRTILITGAGSGIGRGLAILAGQARWNVLVTDVSQQDADETCRMMDPIVKCESHMLDVTQASDVERVMSSPMGKSVDVLVNNAGLQHVAKLEDFPEEAWNQLIQVMLHGAFLMTRAALTGMRQREFGRIINIGSIHSLVASRFKSAYVTAKHGLLGFTKVVSLETADTDITINTICPSYVRTPLVEKQIAAQAKEHGISEDDVVQKIMLQPMPKRAFISLPELFGIVEFLVSDVARNITGQTITVDGGWTAS